MTEPQAPRRPPAAPSLAASRHFAPRHFAPRLLAGLLLLLAACAPEPAPPPTTRAAPPPRSAEPSGVQPPGVQSPGVQPGPELGPKAGGLTKPGVEEAESRQDVEQCYGYAQGVVERNRQIESDRSAAIYDTDPADQTLIFRQQMRQYESRNLLRDSYTECMRSKGYREP